MDFNQAVDLYCERTDASLLSEPLNLVTNLGFILAAWFAARHRGTGQPTPSTKILYFLAYSIGIGSAVFHSFATQWAKLADVIPIAAFVVYFLVTWLRNKLTLPWPRLFGVLTAFALVNALFMLALRGLPLAGSEGYFGLALFLIALGIHQRRYFGDRPYLLYAGLVFIVALAFRTLDVPLCDQWPMGLHFLWHSLNGIVVYLCLRADSMQLAGIIRTEA